ncbi:flagellin [Arcobacter sp. s6]|uniref:flagellin N-terminal helical domain-containing protein n=1 Tax=Arcobacter sp. s6 TaxID=3230363 RepID=UPI00349FD302
MIINTNVSSLTAQEASKNTNNSISSSLEKLSTGLKINKASDDASGLAIADKLRTQQTSINQGVSNGNSAVSLLQIADKSMSEQSSILDTVKAKLIQANTDTTSDDGREAIRKDISKLLEQLDNIAKQTNYNGTTLLQAGTSDNLASGGLNFQVGEKQTDTISNTSIQSNTLGLAGAKEALSAGVNDEIKNGAAELVTTVAGTATTFTGATSSDVTVSGKIGTLLAAGNLTISNANAADTAKLKELVSADFVDNSDGTFTLTSGKSIDFGTFNVNSIALKDAGNGAISITTTAIEEITVTNNNKSTAAEDLMTIGGASDVGASLQTLKNLDSGELTKAKASIFQGVIDESITTLNGYRGDIGSTQNQVESAVRNLMTQSTNVAAAESIIRDVDYAQESANFNKQNIISQAGSYAISQANTVQQNVLKLLQ